MVNWFWVKYAVNDRSLFAVTVRGFWVLQSCHLLKVYPAFGIAVKVVVVPAG